MPDSDPASPSFERAGRTRSRIRALRDDRMGAVNGMATPSGHPDMLLVRILVFARREERDFDLLTSDLIPLTFF